MSEGKLSPKERELSNLIRDQLHAILSGCMKVAKDSDIDHGTALTIAHREASLVSLGMLGSLMMGQEDEERSNDLLFMSQTRYQLDMGVMIDSFEKVSGRTIKREFQGAAYNA